ncbi:uncharacterized protein ehbp1l1a isoform X1 [Silurus meridionalis]|uniref:uncharacterized protein ehbp1l1a isoform X1 n=1 Tax=Silurus meridionalis TaxID=175797 RepID=UPI001EECC04B|nr:uncharacterized protein ehbp1l1a isoform X1 [Silurus meridionalis]
MVCHLQSTPKAPSVSEAQSFELPKSDLGVVEKTLLSAASQTITSSVKVSAFTSPLAEVKCILSQESTEMKSIFTENEENLELQIEPTNLHNNQTDQIEKEINLDSEVTFSPENINFDQGEKNLGAFLPFCPTHISPSSQFTSTCDTDQSQSGVLRVVESTSIREEVNNMPINSNKSDQDYEAVKPIVDMSGCSDKADNRSQSGLIHKAEKEADDSEPSQFFLSDVSGFLSVEDIKMKADVQWPKDESLLQEESQEKRIKTVAPKDTEYQDRQGSGHMDNPQLSESTILFLQLSKDDNSKICRQPGMVSILPSCPKASLIPGLPSLYSTDNAIKWQLTEGSKRIMACKKEQAKNIHNSGIQHHDNKILNENILLKPTCSKTVSIPGFPSVPLDTKDIPSSINFLPTCPKTSRIPGLPSKLQFTISEHDSWSKSNIMLWERKHCKKKVQILHSFSESSDMIKAMIQLRPSCSRASKVAGFPSTATSIPQKPPCIVNMLPSCPKISSIAGFTSLFLCTEQDVSSCPFDSTQLFVMQSKKDNVRSIHNVGKPYDDITQVRNMFSLTLTCPATAAPGFPSIPKDIEKLPNMFNLSPSCPTTSKVSGMPSKLLLTELDGEHKYKDNVILLKRQLRKSDPHVLFISTYYAVSAKSMSLIRTTCSTQSKIHGFPSAPKQRPHYKDPHIVNMMPSCPNNSKIVGFPSITVRTDQDIQKWRLSNEQITKMPKKRQRRDIILSQVLDTFEEDTDFTKTMVTLRPSIPQKAHSPGFPSLSPQDHQYSQCMINLLTSCPKASCAPGIPSVLNTESFSDKWPVDTEPLWIKRIMNTSYCSILLFPPQYEKIDNKDGIQSIVLLKPSCPRKAKIPGLPSAPPPISEEHIMVETCFPMRLGSSFISSFSMTQVPIILTEENEPLKKCDIVMQHLTNNSAVNEVTHINTNEMNTSSLEETNVDIGLWPGSDEGEKGILENGKVDCRMWHSLPSDMSLLLTAGERTECTDAKFPTTHTEQSACDEYATENLTQRPEQFASRYEDEKERVEDMCNLEPLVCNTQSKLQQAQWVPNMADLFPSCPKVCKIPGFPSTALTIAYETEGMDWSRDAYILWRKIMGTKKVEPIQYISQYDKEMLGNMVSLAYSCPGKTSNIGFPSVISRETLEISAISTSCSKISRVAGISSGSLIQEDKPHVEWLNRKECFWDKPAKDKMALIRNKPVQYTEISSIMGAIVPTCPQIALIPGFPSVPCSKNRWKGGTLETILSTCSTVSEESVAPGHLRKALEAQADGLSITLKLQANVVQSMSRLFPACPTISRILGCPSIQESYNLEWGHYQKLYVSKPLNEKTVNFTEAVKHADDVYKNMTLLPTCPIAACFSGFPSAKQSKGQEPNMQNIRPTCPMLSYIAGCQSIQILWSSTWPTKQIILMDRQTKNPTLIINQAKEKTMLESNVALLPTCPFKTCISGFPFVPEPKMQNMFPSCPKRSNNVGFPSKEEQCL